MSLKNLFLSVQMQIKTLVPELKEVEYFNNQFEDTNHDSANDNKQQAIPYPCLFIEFPEDNPGTSSGTGVKSLDVLIRLHIGWEFYKKNPLDMFDLLDKIESAIEGYSEQNDITKTYFSYLTYVAQRTSHSFTNVVVHEFDYRTTFKDVTKLFTQNDIIVTGKLLDTEVNFTQSL